MDIIGISAYYGFIKNIALSMWKLEGLLLRASAIS